MGLGLVLDEVLVRSRDLSFEGVERQDDIPLVSVFVQPYRIA